MDTGENGPGRLIRVRWSGSCARCSASVAAGAPAWWDANQKALTCLVCEPDPGVADPRPDPPQAVAQVPPPDEAAPVALTDAERGVAGASARAEGARRSRKREERIRAKHPKAGGVILALSDDPTSTQVWAQGAAGEERIGSYLEAARPKGIEVLHDRRIPKSRANIDHLVIGPTGVWVIDTKRYLKGRLESRAVGWRNRRETRLFIGGRDKTDLIEAMHQQVWLVERALYHSPFRGTPMHGALCFVDTEVGLFARPYEIQGIHVTWRKRLLRPIVGAPAGAGALDEVARVAIARYLAQEFPSA